MSEIDAFTAFAIAVEALGYAAGLLAIGSGLFLCVHARRPFAESDPEAVRRLMRRTAWLGTGATLAAAAFTGLDVETRAGRLSGMGIGGMVDPMMLEIVWDGPVGRAVTLRLLALAAVLAGLILWRRGAGRLLLGAGAFGYALSFAFVGHATGEPRWLLAGAVTVHVLAAGFWFGAFAPLAMAARWLAIPDAVGLLEAFGRAAVAVVAALVAAGATLALSLLGTPAGLLTSAYGFILTGKLSIVLALLALAAINKLWLVPALQAGDTRARRRLVASITLETLAVAAILIATALLTTAATPPF